MFLVRTETLEEQRLQTNHQGPQALGTRIDHQVRDLAIERITRRHQLGQTGARIGRLEQRAIAIPAGAVPEIIDVGTQRVLFFMGGPTWARTRDPLIMSQML